MIARTIITIGVQNYGRARGNEGGLHKGGYVDSVYIKEIAYMQNIAWRY